MSAPAYHELAARQLYVDGFIKQAKGLARDDRGTGARATSSGFAGATLENAKIDVLPVPNAGETDIDALRKTLMPFDQGAEFIDRR